MASSSRNGNFYAILELDATADSAAIAASYRRLAKLRHPDKSPGNPQATAEFQKLQEAYSVLSDPVMRSRYDAIYSSAVPPPGPSPFKTPRKSKKFRTPFYTFHVGTTWDDSYGHNAASSNATEDPLEEEIRKLRKQLNDEDVTLQRMRSSQTKMANEIDGIWRMVQETDLALRHIDSQMSDLLQYDASMTWYHYKTAQTQDVTGDAAWAEMRMAELLARQRDLKGKRAQLQQALDDKTAWSRTFAAEMNIMTKQKADIERQFHELCKNWRSREFHNDKKTADAEEWNGWNGWCGWGHQEAEASSFAQESYREQHQSSAPYGGAPAEDTAENAGNTKCADPCDPNDDLLTFLETDKWERSRASSRSVSSSRASSKHAKGEVKAPSGTPHAKPPRDPDADVDLLDFDDDEVAGEEPDKDNIRWPGRQKREETAKIWEQCKNEWHRSLWQEW